MKLKKLKEALVGKELPHVAKIKSMANKGKNIPFTAEEVKSMPKGFTPSNLFYNRKSKNYNPQTSKYIGRTQYNMPLPLGEQAKYKKSA